MHSYMSVYSGNQQLSWYNTTIEAAQPHPSVLTAISTYTHFQATYGNVFVWIAIIVTNRLKAPCTCLIFSAVQFKARSEALSENWWRKQRMSPTNCTNCYLHNSYHNNQLNNVPDFIVPVTENLVHSQFLESDYIASQYSFPGHLWDMLLCEELQ